PPDPGLRRGARAAAPPPRPARARAPAAPPECARLRAASARAWRARRRPARGRLPRAPARAREKQRLPPTRTGRAAGPSPTAALPDLRFDVPLGPNDDVDDRAVEE